MERLVQFTAGNWESIYTFSAVAEPKGNNSHIPIPPTSAPFLLTENIISVYIGTQVPANRNWVFGGRAVREFRTGLTIGGGVDAASKPEYLYCNKVTTIFFPRVSAEYSLKFYFPRWFKSVNLTCWKYTGTDDNETDVQIAQEFANVNFKLDQLLGG